MIGSRHLRTSVVARALEHGFGDGDRWRAFVHFGSGCRRCWERFDRLAKTEIPWDPDSGARRDLVVRALRRPLAVLRGELDVPVVMTPIHLYWARRATNERAAFRRLVVEEGQLLELEAPGEGFGALASLAGALEKRRAGLSRAQRHDLAALAHLYLGHGIVARRGCLAPFTEVWGHLEQAARHRRRGSGDPEVLFLELVLGSRVEVKDGLLSRAHERLFVAEHVLSRFLESRPSPAHLAELRFYQGLDALDGSRYAEARERFADALVDLPEECGYARFFAVRHLAALCLVLNDRRRLRGYLHEAERLAELHGPAMPENVREGVHGAMTSLKAALL